MFRRGRGWMRALLRRAHVESEMQDEIREHLARAAERLEARGLSPGAARAQARREFGNVAVIEEDARDARGVQWIDDAVQDVRFGVRSLARSPAFTLVAVLSLVLGIGVNTAIFTAVNATMRPFTVHEPSTFVSIPQTWSAPASEALREHVPALADVILRADERVLLAPTSAADEPMRAAAELVSPNYFAALHAPMALGRPFGPADERVGVLNYRSWKTRFAGDSSLLGRVLRLANGTSFTVVGIAGRDFSGVRRGGPDFWLPLAMRPAIPAVSQAPPPRGDWFGANRYAWLTVYGRLAADHTAREAQTQVNVALERLAAADSGFAPGLSRGPMTIVTAAEARARGGQGSVKRTLIAATLLVLLVACFNVAGLMLARAADRRREIAVRLSLGASRARLLRQLLTESAIIVGAGATLAFVLSFWMLRAFAFSGGLAFITDDDPERLARLLTPNASVFGFALLLAAASVVACGLVPALRATRPDLAGTMKADRAAFGDVGRARLRGVLTSAQLALSLVLLLSAGVLTRSLMRALSLDVGYDRASMWRVSSTLTMAGYDTARVRELSRAFEQRLATIPSVQTVARGDVPVVGGRFRTTLTLVGGTTHEGFVAAVTPNYFTTLGIPIVRGRAFTDSELRDRAQVVVVSETTARTLWPNEDPLGKTLAIDPRKKGLIAPETIMRSATVIGVAKDAQMVDLAEIPSTYIYLPSASGELLLRVGGNATVMASLIRDAARAIDPGVLVSIDPLHTLFAENGALYNARFSAMFAAAIGGLALVLASIGVFGLMAYMVARRTRELGVRMALGARARDIGRLVLADGLRVVAVGAVIGVVGAFAASRLLRSLMFGMNPLDPIAYAGVTALLVCVAMAACYVPARRATRIDPLVALKSD
jgi:predicted permease